MSRGYEPPLEPLDDGPGPALPLTRERAEFLVDSALAAAEGRRGAVPRRGWLALAVACLVLGAATASAVTWILVRPDAPERSASAPADPKPRAASTQPTMDEPETEEARAEDVATDDGAGTEHGREGAEESGTEEDSSKPTVRKRPNRARPAAVEDLLLEANRARAERRWRRAARLYERVIKTVPGTNQSYVASVALGDLYLVHLGSPARARRHYTAALRTHPGGSLSEEARFGIAESWRRSGDVARERKALQSFLQAHPEGAMAARARTRLRQLKGPDER